MYYSNTPEKYENNYEQLKNRTANVIFKEKRFIVCTFSNSENKGKEKQKTQFTNANMNNKKL